MKISVIGTGYVGSVTGAGLADLGHHIIFVGRDQKKLDLIQSGKSPIFEKGLDELLAKNRDSISTSTDLVSAIRESELCFICVGTPSNADGSIDLQQVRGVSVSIGKGLDSDDQYHTIVVKSTVFPGTTEGLVIPVIERESGKTAGIDWGIASNPEFLKEGCAIEDFFQADRVIIGTNDQKSRHILESIYEPLNVPIYTTSIRTAEMIKYASNAFLATKISYANEIGNLCKRLDIDTRDVFTGVGMDHRIGPDFFRSGIGFGGSCFPKDVRALIAGARSVGIDLSILASVLKVNESQPLRMLSLLHAKIPALYGKTIGVLGLAFKPDTDDIRESRAIPVIDSLIREGAEVAAYDPMAMDNFRGLYPNIRYANTAGEVLAADAVLIITEWPEFEDIDYTETVVIDGKRVDAAERSAGWYQGVCW